MTVFRGRFLFILAVTIAICRIASVAGAGGLFPDMDEMFGTAMPSVGLAIGREASEKCENDNGSQEKYLDFNKEDYLVFGQYLAGVGAKVQEYEIDGSILTATISVRDLDMIFSYNWAEQKAIVLYPSGARVETELERVEQKESILPPFDGVMPSAEFAINRKPDEQVSEDGQLIQKWNRFSDEDYTAFSAYLGETGATLKDSSIVDGKMNADISLKGSVISFTFNWRDQTAKLVYPNGTSPETSRWNTIMGKGFVLPEIENVGRELPRISMALEREPSLSKKTEDGGVQETYLDFSEGDYNAFSQYLREKDCVLDDFFTDDNGTLIIRLSNGSGRFTFSYDSVRQIGTAIYPAETRIEKAWKITPTPAPTETPKPERAEYSESDCWRTAYTYFHNLRWKNPQSVTIHGHTSTYSNGEYRFTIDYSAENGFGGTNRGYYWITVDASDRRVTSAFGSD